MNYKVGDLFKAQDRHREDVIVELIQICSSKDYLVQVVDCQKSSILANDKYAMADPYALRKLSPIEELVYRTGAK